MMQQLSLFSGIGGIDIAAEWAGFETICFVENDKYCQNVLKKQWPNVPIIEDVKDVTKERIMAYAEQQRPGIFSSGASGEQPRCWERLSESRSATEGIALISGGFPCQPHSVAGKREGSTDERNLWPEFRRVIGEIKPRWVLAENVPGIFSSDAGRFFGAILSDLAEMGYSAGWATYGAVDVGALHRRNRVFIVAHTINSSDRRERGQSGESGLSNQRKGKQVTERRKDDSNPGYEGLQGSSEGETPWEQDISCESRRICEHTGATEQWTAQCRLGKPTNGIPGRLDCNWGDGWEDGTPRVTRGQKDRVARLKALGNAVVPQQIFPILQAIAEKESL